MKSIFVATDFSKRSDLAVARGAALAKAHGAKLTVAHIVDDDQSQRLSSAAETEAGALFDALSASLQRDYGLKPSIVVTRGDPHAEILNAAKRVDADLIVIGSHRRNLVRNTFIGTTAERSVRSSNIPVLIARSPVRKSYRHPLIALDLNERELHPLSAAIALGIFDASQATVVFAFDLYGNYHLLRQAGATDAELQKYIREEEAMVRPRAQSILEKADVKPADMVLKPAFFNAHDPVLETASEKAADLIVVGTKRKQAFERFRIGSVSEAVVRRADMDVLIVPPEQ